MQKVRLYAEPKDITPDPIKNLSQNQVLEMLKKYNLCFRIENENFRFNKGLTGFAKKLSRRAQGETSALMTNYNSGKLSVLRETLENLGQEKAMTKIEQQAYDDILKGERSTTKPLKL